MLPTAPSLWLGSSLFTDIGTPASSALYVVRDAETRGESKEEGAKERSTSAVAAANEGGLKGKGDFRVEAGTTGFAGVVEIEAVFDRAAVDLNEASGFPSAGFGCAVVVEVGLEGRILAASFAVEEAVGAYREEEVELDVVDVGLVVGGTAGFLALNTRHGIPRKRVKSWSA